MRHLDSSPSRSSGDQKIQQNWESFRAWANNPEGNVLSLLATLDSAPSRPDRSTHLVCLALYDFDDIPAKRQLSAYIIER